VTESVGKLPFFGTLWHPVVSRQGVAWYPKTQPRGTSSPISYGAALRRVSYFELNGLIVGTFPLPKENIMLKFVVPLLAGIALSVPTIAQDAYHIRVGESRL
jgi:hypothetical protein